MEDARHGAENDGTGSELCLAELGELSEDAVDDGGDDGRLSDVVALGVCFAQVDVAFSRTVVSKNPLYHVVPTGEELLKLARWRGLHCLGEQCRHQTKGVDKLHGEQGDESMNERGQNGRT